jgi:hypothetical protein
MTEYPGYSGYEYRSADVDIEAFSVAGNAMSFPVAAGPILCSVASGPTRDAGRAGVLESDGRS